MIRVGAAAFAVALLLVAPATSFGQSAGDEQYLDPFAGRGETQEEPNEPTSPAPPPAPAPTPAPAASVPTETTTVEPTATVAGTLPRTGRETAWVAATGLALIAAGTGVRRSARP